jgi:hypothetical protein
MAPYRSGLTFWPRNPIMHNKLDDHSVDEGNEEYVRPTIFWNDQLSFQMDLDVSVLREDKMNEILDAIENENEQDTQLMFRRFVHELLAELRLKLLNAIDYDDIILQDVPGSMISREELLGRYLDDEVFFPVKKPRCSVSMPSDSVEF